MPVTPGMSAAASLVVADEDTAIAAHTGAVPVLATPRLLALCEEAAMGALDGALGPTQTSVGMQVHLDHLAPTAVGHPVTAQATVEKTSGRRVTFTVCVNDDRGLVAVGRVTRVVVDVERFLERAQG